MKTTTKEELKKFMVNSIMVDFDLQESQITDDAKLQDDLDIDSLDKVGIGLEIEEIFKVTLDDEAIDNATTFGEFVDVAFSSFENTEG